MKLEANSGNQFKCEEVILKKDIEGGVKGKVTLSGLPPERYGHTIVHDRH